MELVEENLNQCSPQKWKTDQEDCENATDDYEGWKSKILKAAAAKEQSMAPCNQRGHCKSNGACDPTEETLI